MLELLLSNLSAFFSAFSHQRGILFHQIVHHTIDIFLTTDVTDLLHRQREGVKDPCSFQYKLLVFFFVFSVLLSLLQVVTSGHGLSRIQSPSS